MLAGLQCFHKGEQFNPLKRKNTLKFVLYSVLYLYTIHNPLKRKNTLKFVLYSVLYLYTIHNPLKRKNTLKFVLYSVPYCTCTVYTMHNLPTYVATNKYLGKKCVTLRVKKYWNI